MHHIMMHDDSTAQNLDGRDAEDSEEDERTARRKSGIAVRASWRPLVECVSRISPRRRDLSIPPRPYFFAGMIHK